MIDKELLDILACPKCKGELEYKAVNEEKNGELVCRQCRLRYMVVDDIPNLIIEDASPMDDGVAG
jgi:uncharacterized protein YbaR (Trm112 family)